MGTSVFLAKLIGPLCLALGVALLLNGASFRKLAQTFIDSPALIFLSGVITLPAGLAIVLTHNVWASDWRVLITILGWLALIAGAIRIVVPQQAAGMGRNLINHPLTPVIAGAVYAAAGALLCYFGYLR